jgi:hypothetical protein
MCLCYIIWRFGVGSNVAVAYMARITANNFAPATHFFVLLGLVNPYSNGVRGDIVMLNWGCNAGFW